MPAIPRRSTLGPTARYFSGSQRCQRSGGSTTWSSTLTIMGISPTVVPASLSSSVTVTWVLRGSVDRMVRPGCSECRGTGARGYMTGSVLFPSVAHHEAVRVNPSQELVGTMNSNERR